MTTDQNRITSGFVSLEGGVDSGRPASIIQPNQASWAVNTTVRGGYPRPRPPFNKLLAGGVLPAGRFQHASFFNGTGDAMLMAVIDGHPYRIMVSDLSVTDVSPPDGPNNANNRQGWSVQAENYWIYQDGKRSPIIFDGGASVRSDFSKYQVPLGTVMQYHRGRLVVVLPNGVNYRAGDLVFSESGTAAASFRDSMLYFTENNYLSGGDLVARVFGAPSDSGAITAMRSQTDLNTSLGQGSLMIYCQNMVFSVNLPFDRTTWQTLTNPLQTVTMINQGATGQNTTVQANGDIFFRALDGERSLVMAYRNYGDPGNVPLSTEVRRALANDDPELLTYGSAVYFDNRLLTTCSPVLTDFGCYHRGLLALDFDLLSSMREKTSPVWEGVWTGLNVLQIIRGLVNGIEHCWIFALNETNQIELWELLSTIDRRVSDNGSSPIHWAIETRSENFTNQFELKRLDAGDLFWDDLQGTFTYNVLWREDSQSCWRPWYSDTLCAKVDQCDFVACNIPLNLQPQSRPQIRLPQPPDVDDTIQGKVSKVAYEFQVRLEMTGFAKLKSLRIHAYTEQEFPLFEQHNQ